MMKHISICILLFLALSAGLSVAGQRVDAASVWKASQQAQRGDVEAQFKLGSYYYYGQGGLPKDYREATKWYRLSAEQGYTRAQIALGLCYFHGHGVKRSYWKGIQLIIFPNGGFKKEKETEHR